MAQTQLEWMSLEWATLKIKEFTEGQSFSESASECSTARYLHLGTYKADAQGIMWCFESNPGQWILDMHPDHCTISEPWANVLKTLISGGLWPLYMWPLPIEVRKTFFLELFCLVNTSSSALRLPLGLCLGVSPGRFREPSELLGMVACHLPPARQASYPLHHLSGSPPKCSVSFHRTPEKAGGALAKMKGI